MRQRSTILILSALVFFSVYLCGFFIASGKPLWLDEHYSITHSTTSVSYIQILQGRFEEWNNAPLFYLGQKVLCDLVSYDPGTLIPVRSAQGMVFYTDPFSNVYLRLISIFFMALAPAALFYYFSRRYSWGWGSFAALLCLSSWLFWWYGLEARPYIHFLALTTLQVIIFLEIAGRKEGDRKPWIWMGIINVLLALTVTTSVLQTLLIGAWFLVFSRRDLNVRRILLVFVLPALIAAYYYAIALKARAFFSVPIYKYYLSNVPWDIVVVVFVFLIYAGSSWFLGDKKPPLLLRWLKRDEIKEAGSMVFFMVSVSMVYFLVLLLLKMRELPLGQGGGPFAHRHLINLVPVGIIAMTVFSRALFQSFDKRLRVFFIIVLAAILAWRFIYAYSYAHAWIGI